MRLSKSVEQAIFVLLMLALQEGHKPVKSRVLSRLLNVSDSYLKKILMKLSRAGLIDANASKRGGYTLHKPIHETSLKDVVLAVEGSRFEAGFPSRGHVLFNDGPHVDEGEAKIAAAFKKGMESYYRELDRLKLSELLHEHAYRDGAVNWEDSAGLDKSGKH